MEQEVYVGRQPILDRRQRIVAYELLFRSKMEDNQAQVTDDLGATSRVLMNTLSYIGVDKLIGNKKAYINVDHFVLKSGFLENLDPTRFVIEILEDTELDDEVIDKIRSLRSAGYKFALDDFVFRSETIHYFRPIFPYLSIVKVDLKENPQEVVRSKLGVFKDSNVQFLAEKVEDMQEFEYYSELGFRLFQGYFFSKPIIIRGKGFDSNKLAVMDIIKEIQKESEIDQLELAFKKYPEMTLTLLKFINSAAISTRSKISSVKQAIALLGRKKLFNWLLLMQYAFSNQTKGTRSPLFYMASHRAKTLELLLLYGMKEKKSSQLDEAFLIGLLSLMDALFEHPLEEVLKELNIGENIYNAIVHHQGKLGKMLLLIEKMESDDFLEVEILLRDLNLSMMILTMASMESYLWMESVAF